MSESITNLSDAVAALGALPVPQGPEPRSRSVLDRARDALGARLSKDDLRLVLENTIAYAAGLESERHSTNEALDDAAKALREQRDRIAELETDLAAKAQDAEAAVNGWGRARARVAGLEALRARREDDDPARCLKAHPFSPRDGWRMVCGNCDHGKDAECHRVGGA